MCCVLISLLLNFVLAVYIYIDLYSMINALLLLIVSLVYG